MPDPITSTPTTLGPLSEILDLRWREPSSPTVAERATPILDITDDSRRVKPGSLFIARSGTSTDGASYIGQAIAQGAVAIVAGPDVQLPDHTAARPPLLIAEDPTRAVAHAAHLFHGSPSDHLTLVGITGTNGKTTIAHLLQQIFNAAGHRCGLMGTVCTDTGDGPMPATLTTPSSCDVASLLGAMCRAGCSHAVMEVSSHALHQGRVAALRFDGAIFTNLSGDHLDYHKTMDEYADAKARLFQMLDHNSAVAIYNADDPAAQRITARTHGRRLGVSLDPSFDGWRVKHSETTSDLATEIHLVAPDGRQRCFPIQLVGAFNVVNTVQAVAMAVELGVDLDVAVRAMADAHAPPGRLERVTLAGSPFTVFVDYAHTDDALDRALAAVRPVVPNGGRLVVLFGCGGDRDRTKRPRMAVAACRHADVVCLTSDNPRTEAPDAIIEDVRRGFPESSDVIIQIQADRARAIDEVIRDARPMDVIVVAGKGHEDYQIIGTTKSHFDDRAHVRQAIQRHFGDPASARRETS